MGRKSFLIVVGICLVAWAALFLNGLLLGKKHAYYAWEAHFPTLGTLASPAAADLTGDGVLDIVVGAGGAPFAASDSAVLALDGADGRLLWVAAAEAQLFGRPVFLELTGDATPDVLMAGRRAQLLAVDGASGDVLWRYRTQDTVVNPTGYARFNFYGPRLIPDRSGDGVPDLLLANGGNELAADHSPIYRYPGVLIIIDSRDGSVIAADTMPDGRETYLLPLVRDLDADGELDIVFGTGGETIGGALYRTTLTALMNEDLSGAQRLAANAGSGFIAAPVAADVDGDGRDDILAAAYDGQVFAVDGASGALHWRTAIDRIEIYGAPVSGQFTGDATPDLFVRGARPSRRRAPGQALQLLLDGATGAIVHLDSTGCGSMASGTAFDADGDGRPEVLFSSHSYRLPRPDFLKTVHTLQLLNVEKGTVRAFYPLHYAKNLAATPWTGDLDGDGRLDVVYCRLSNRLDYFEMGGLTVERLSTDVPVFPESIE